MLVFCICEVFFCTFKGTLSSKLQSKNVAYGNKNKLFLAHIHFLLYLCSEIVGNVRLLLPTLKNDANGMREGRMLHGI
jgi:hypothetical protein